MMNERDSDLHLAALFTVKPNVTRFPPSEHFYMSTKSEH